MWIKITADCETTSRGSLSPDFAAFQYWIDPNKCVSALSTTKKSSGFCRKIDRRKRAQRAQKTSFYGHFSKSPSQ